MVGRFVLGVVTMLVLTQVCMGTAVAQPPTATITAVTQDADPSGYDGGQFEPGDMIKTGAFFSLTAGGGPAPTRFTMRIELYENGTGQLVSTSLHYRDVAPLATVPDVLLNGYYVSPYGYSNQYLAIITVQSGAAPHDTEYAEWSSD